MAKHKDEWTPEEWAYYYDTLAQRAYTDYQATGESRYDNRHYQYSQIAEAFRALAREKGEKEIDMKKRMTNCDYVIGRLIPNKDYSFTEVCKLLKEAVWW